MKAETIEHMDDQGVVCGVEVIFEDGSYRGLGDVTAPLADIDPANLVKVYRLLVRNRKALELQPRLQQVPATG